MSDVCDGLAGETAPTPAPTPETSAALAYMTKLFERSSEAAKIGVWECNLDGEHLRWTDVVYDIFDLPRGSQLDRVALLDFYTPASREELERVRREAIRRGDGFTLDAEIRTPAGREKWIRITATVESDAQGPVRIFGLKQDVSEEKALVRRTRFLAEYDSLTSLGNRALFQRRLSELLAAPDPRVSLLLIDLDGFKEINDGFGHAHGDRCLAETARRLRRACDDADLIARVGGDEFGVIFSRVMDDDELVRAAARIVEACREPVAAAGDHLQLGASIGIASLGPGRGSEPQSLVPDADLALYAAKAAGKSGFRIFERSLRDAAERRRRVIATMEKALAAGDLRLFYQPKARIADGRLHGFEALLRRRKADGSFATPAQFMAALEDPDLSRRIGRWVVAESIEQAARWRAQGVDFRSLSINASSSQLRDPGFAERLIEEARRRDVPPATLEIEITEGVFLGDERDVAFQSLTELRKHGFRIAVDDFGTGFASLVHLRNYPIDVIKIDRSFVANMTTSPPDVAILECMLDLGVRLQKDVVVEGVETAEQLTHLRILGARLAQGLYFSPAAPADEAQRFMDPAWRWATA